MAMHDYKLARNIFLAMKHAWEDNFYRENFEKVIIFEAEKIRGGALFILLRLLFEYVTNVSSFNTQELRKVLNTPQ